MVRVSTCSSLSGIRMLIATCSNYLLPATLNTSSIKDKLHYLNYLLPVVFQRKKKFKSVSKQLLNKQYEELLHICLALFPPNSEAGQLVKQYT